MKLLLMLVLVALSTPLVFADDCSTGTLASYIAAGSCSIGDKTFSDFNYVISSGSGTPAAGVVVNPFNDITGIGLTFTGNWSVLAGTTQTDIIGYFVSASSSFVITGANLSNGFGVAGSGSLNVDELLGNGSALSVFENSSTLKPFDSVTFAGVGSLSVQDTIALNGGPAGSALATDFRNGFSQTPVPESTVPEPSTLLLLGSGFVGLLGIARRKRLG